MPFLLRTLCYFRHQQRRCIYESVASIKCVRDRGLDHAVEREKNLKPVLNLKNLIKSEPSKATPLSLITQSKDSLEIPVRPIEFVRKYPSIFEEFLPGGIAIHPHIKLTPQVINYDKEEEIICQSVDYKQEVADRLLKLLMISRINKIPLSVVDKLKWAMGLPQDYVRTIVPEFPDYFRVINDAKEEVLELVCWSNELAVSVMEKKGVVPVEFCLTDSNGFEMDKKYKKWLDEWQKLPYVSPYENAQHLASKSDESDKWTVAVLHEILNLFIGKKAERGTVLGLGEYLGLRSRFKVALLQHPGIFYVSSKIRTHTVVLKEAYKRGMLIEKHPLMQMRSRYVQLMNAGKDDQKSKSEQQKTNLDSKESQTQETFAEDDDVSGYEDGDLSAEEIDDEDDDEYDDDDDDDDDAIKEYENVNAKGRGRDSRKIHFDREGSSRPPLRRYADDIMEYENVNAKGRGRDSRKIHFDREGSSRPPLRRYADDIKEYENVNAKGRGRDSRKIHFDREGSSRPPLRRYADDIKEYENVNAKGRGRDSRKIHFDREGSSRPALRRSDGRQSVGNAVKSSTSTHRRRSEVQNSQKDPRQLRQRFDISRNRNRSESFRPHS